MFKKIILTIIILSMILVAGCTTTNPTTSNNSDKLTPTNPGKDIISDPTQKLCENSNGSWDNQYKECTGISEQDCTKIGGKFNECASACRHNPEAQMCTMQCVIICQFN